MLDSQWQTMMSQIMQDGVVAGKLNTLNVTAGTGLQVSVATGYAFLIGLFVNNDAAFAINLAAADPSNPRIDNIVIHADLVGKTVTLIALTGTPNASPVVPAITQSGTVWEISLNNVRVNANATVPSTFTDTRQYTPNWQAIYQAPGLAETGVCGGQQKAVTAGDVFGAALNYKRKGQKAATSITFGTLTHTNATVQTATSIQPDGFLYNWTGTAAGLTTSYDTYSTVGNCLRAIYAGLFDIHCDGCEEVKPHIALKRGRSLYHDLQIVEPHGKSDPGLLSLRHECPDCGTVECFNTALGSQDECMTLAGWERRMEQAYLIREAQDLLKVPMLA